MALQYTLREEKIAKEKCEIKECESTNCLFTKNSKNLHLTVLILACPNYIN